MTELKLNPIVLLTDFGNQDWFVGVMKGVIAQASPHIPVIDLTHGIEHGNIEQAAFVLSVSFGSFPAGSVFVCVVDPGVGSERIPVAVRFKHCWLVGPNNGLFTFCFSQDNSDALCYRIKTDARLASNTFHGRDLFAPVAARLALGHSIDELSEGFCEPVLVESSFRTSGTMGTIQYFDRFGNAITNLVADPQNVSSGHVTVEGIAMPFSVCRTFADTDAGQPLAYAGSCGLLELAVRNGSAKDGLGLKLGSRVQWHK